MGRTALLVRRAVSATARSARGRRVLAVVRDEADRALANARYDDRYFATGGDGRSGYADYAHGAAQAEALAWLAWSTTDGSGPALDVGCATGRVVEVLTCAGLDARGVDVSRAAVAAAPPPVRSRLAVVDVRDPLPFPDGAFALVTAFETLEHLEPAAVPGVVAELARVAAGPVVATIPSFGPNPSGWDGWFDAKVRPKRLDHYRSLPSSFDGPVPAADLAVDADDLPVEGHLTIASYRWWTERFAEVGLERCDDLERTLNVDVARLGLARYVCLYVLRPADTAEPAGPVRSPAERATLAAELGLDLTAGPPHEVAQAEARLS